MAKRKQSLEKIQRGSKPLSKIVVSAFVVLVAVGFIWGIFAVANSIGKANEVPESEQITRSLSGKSIAEDKADAAAAVSELLKSTNPEASIELAAERIAAMDGGDFSSFEEGFIDRIRYYDAYEENATLQQEVAMSVFSLATVAREAKGAVELDSNNLGAVRLDQEIGIAQVPIELFTGKSSPISFEMVYVDGSWKLEPHTLSSYIRLSASLQAG